MRHRLASFGFSAAGRARGEGAISRGLGGPSPRSTQAAAARGGSAQRLSVVSRFAFSAAQPQQKLKQLFPPASRLPKTSTALAMGSRHHLFEVLVLGDSEVGKTSLVRRYSQDSFREDEKATVGVDFALKVLQWSDSEMVRLQLWDIAGRERCISMARLFYRVASACVIMFDVTDATTLRVSQKWKQELDSDLTLRKREPVPCLLLANKCDLSPWAVSRDQVDRFSKENGFTDWMETSVKENKNVNEAMRVLIEKMMSNSKEDMSLSSQGDHINLRAKPSYSWGCC